MRRAMFANLNRQRGVTLIELVVFIIIVGVIVSSLAAGFSSTLKGSTLPIQMTQALQIAQGRLELSLARKPVLGFAGFTTATFDPCALPAGTQQGCLTPIGYTVAPNLSNDWNGDTNYKIITIEVSDAQGKLAKLMALVANY